MKRIEIGSRIEIWSANYINKKDDRNKRDIDVNIIQIESSKDIGNYMVEVSSKENKYIKWIPVSKRLPEPSKYDWVLVKMKFKEGYSGVPHIAEFKNGHWQWMGSSTNEDMEKMFRCKVTHWKPIPDEEV